MPTSAFSDPIATAPRARARIAWASLALTTGTTLALLRMAALLVMFCGYRGEALDPTIARIASTLGYALPFALVVGALAASIALWAVAPDATEHGATRRASARALRLALAITASSGLFLAVLSGWPVDISEYVPDATDPHGRAGLLRLAAVAVVGACVLVWVARGVVRKRGLGGLLGRGGVFACVLAFSVLVPAALYARAVSLRSERVLRESVRELLFEEPSWTVEERHPGREPYVDVLTPTRNFRIDGGDMPALILPPPARVRFTVRPEDGPVMLRTSAGLQFRQYDFSPECAVGFRIEVNGASVFDDEIRVVQSDGEAQRAWRHVGGTAGVALRPGDVVSLSTTLLTPELPRERWPVITAGFGGLSLERKITRPRETASSASPNIVLIVMDTLRADRLSCYGYHLATTPALDRLAARGILYEQAYATSSWTWPATASILTGLSPEAHGVVDDAACHLSSRLDTLAEALARSGYVTGAFSCNPLIVANTRFDQGFERFDASGRDFRKTDAVLPLIVDWLREQAPYRFFLYLHLVDPHAPLLPSSKARALVGGSEPRDYSEAAINTYVRRLLDAEGHTPSGESRPELVIPPEHQRWLEQSYTAAIATSDEYVGRVLDELSALGLDENTLVAFTSDHGEELLDHGLLTHGQSLYEELVRVPLILAGAGVAQRGVRCDAVVSNRHIAPTLARIGGGRLAQAENALDLVRPFPPPSEPVFFSTSHGWWNGRRERLQIHGVREGSWVLHYAPSGRPWGAALKSDPGDGQVRLYDLSTDPGQNIDRSGERAELALRLRELLEEHVRIAGEQRPALVLGAGRATMDMLRNTGYAGDDEGALDAEASLEPNHPPDRR